MSGPKLVGLTCDPEVIRRNEETLKRIGKEKYFGGIFTNLNIDIYNEQKWIESYATSTLRLLPEGFIDEVGTLNEIENLKKTHIEKAEEQKIKMSVIKKHNADWLNDFGADKVKAIPKWKQDFLNEVGKLLQRLQEEVDYFFSEEHKNKVINDRLMQEQEEARKRCESYGIKSDIKVEAMPIVGCNESSRKATYRSGIKDDIAADRGGQEDIPFGLQELAILEMLQLEADDFSGISLKDSEREQLLELLEDLKKLTVEADEYSNKSKRQILSSALTKSHTLSKEVARRKAAENAALQLRSVAIIEYQSFVEALGYEEENYSKWTLEQLEKKVEELRDEVKKQEERIYVEESIEDIMEGYGYDEIDSYHLHDADDVSNIVFENASGGKISASFGDGIFMLKVVGEGENPPTKEEKKEQYVQQVAFCAIYPEIKRRLEEKGIHISTENVTPPSEKHAENIQINRQEDIEQSTKKKSINKFNYRSYGSKNKKKKADKKGAQVGNLHVQYIDD